MDHIYDVIILGAGPAGLSAGLYAGRSRLDTLIIEKGQAGGQIINTDEIENYPGQIVEGETGVSLVRRMYEQTEQFGAEHVRDTITDVELNGEIKVLTGEKDTYQAKNIIIATGAYARPIGCKGEQEYKGRGISYCATCDANFFTDLEVYVAGGGDAAVEEALYLTKFARKVTIIHRRDELRAAKSIQEKAFANPKIAFLWDSVVEEVSGDGLLQTMTVKNIKTGEFTKIEADRSMHFQHWLREEQSLRGSSWDRTDGKKPVSRQRRWYGLSRSVQSALQCLYIWENPLFYIQYLEKSTRM